MAEAEANVCGPITDETFARFLRCELEAYLQIREVSGGDREFANWRRRSRDRYKQAALAVLRSRYSDDEIHVGMPTAAALKQRRWRLIIDGIVETRTLHACVDAAELARSPKNGPLSYYRPIRFAPADKVGRSDNLLLAFDALALSRATGIVPPTGRIVHGHRHAKTTIPLSQLVREVRLALGKIAALRARTAPLRPVLNKYCVECEFRSRCRAKALETDDLSLLAGLNRRELKTWNDKGISTITQLSYTFRPRRYSRRRPSRPVKHDPALKALALRKNQIHVVGAPTWPEIGNPVYFDVEGVPDQEFYYLIGLRYRRGDQYVYRSFWADDPSKEGEMWAGCLHDLQDIDAPRLIHYGSYETQFLKRMKARYPTLASDPDRIDYLILSSLNLISFTYAQIYFPTHTNSLKEIGRFLRFQWSDSNASGLRALLWRCEWEDTRNPDIKQNLITYNADDCEAAQRLSEAISSICREQELGPANIRSVNVDGLASEYPRCFGPLQYAVPAFEKINTAAYWDYQRSKVYIRSSTRLKRASKASVRRAGKSQKTDKVVQVEDARPAQCSRCGGTAIYKNGHLAHTIYDLRFTATGVRRWIVRYLFKRYQCWACKAGFNELPRQGKYGQNLKVYLAYQLIKLLVPQHALTRHLRTLFDLDVPKQSMR